MHPLIIVIGHYCGLAGAIAGAALLAGWPGAILAFSAWLVLVTSNWPDAS
jgi:hypothetical protein